MWIYIYVHFSMTFVFVSFLFLRCASLKILSTNTQSNNWEWKKYVLVCVCMCVVSNKDDGTSQFRNVNQTDYVIRLMIFMIFFIFLYVHRSSFRLVFHVNWAAIRTNSLIFFLSLMHSICIAKCNQIFIIFA